MTREEAILCIKGIKNLGHDMFTEQKDFQECLDMAIKAIEQEPCDDCVSRQAVLKIVNGGGGSHELYVVFERLTREVKALPPATPTQKWIPVSERFPEEKDGYLVTVHGYVTTALWVGHAEYWDKVTAWMPLPKPYKTDNKTEQNLNYTDQDTMMPAT